MPRLARICPPDIPQHIIQRGNNRQICFATEMDFSLYINGLKELSRKHKVQIHAWVLMTNHVHLLVTPTVRNGISPMMQDLGRQYVTYFNKMYKRTGTLWEGRFKSCLVDTESYLLQCYRYIELNPVRACMVNDPADYVWSSYQCNALGKQSSLITRHRKYMELGLTPQQRLDNYRALFKDHINGKLLTDIRQTINTGMALGSDKFKDEVESNLQKRVHPLKPGRPKKHQPEIGL